jgi:DNA-binding winged helix-turn-helix (wHTH) protein
MSSGEDFSPLIRFGAFEADLQARELRKHGLKIKLQDQPFQILALLLERPGEVVSREELHKKLWATDTFVDFDRGLNRAINRLRDALGDSSDSPRFIETLPKRGYRFVALVQRTPVQSDSHGRPTEPPVLRPPAPPLSLGNPSRIKIWSLVVATVLIAGAAAFYYLRRPVVLTERDTVVLADFDNRTGDPAFDFTLKQALAVDLQQSPFLEILSDQRVTDTLRLMQSATDQPVTRDL